jgi:hypothetical protein
VYVLDEADSRKVRAPLDLDNAELKLPGYPALVWARGVHRYTNLYQRNALYNLRWRWHGRARESRVTAHRSFWRRWVAAIVQLLRDRDGAVG